ncbi:MAG: hypothetical protein Q7R52_05675 [archaeon]|nr:hypothetical protein [archaeon]
MNLTFEDIVNVPAGRYRVFGRNNNLSTERCFFHVRDCKTPDEAISVVNAEEESELDANGGIIGTANFYVINERGSFLYGMSINLDKYK